MFDDLLTHFESALDEGSLASPLSVDQEGNVVSALDYVDVHGPESVRLLFGRPADVHAGRRVKPVASLDDDEAKRVAQAVLENAEPDVRIAGLGVGDISLADLRREVDEGSDVGREFVRAVRLRSMFVERAIRAGQFGLEDR